MQGIFNFTLTKFYMELITDFTYACYNVVQAVYLRHKNICDFTEVRLWKN